MKSRQVIKLKALILSIIVSSISFIGLSTFFDRVEDSISDSYFRDKYYGKVRESSIRDIVIVDIDTRSEQKLGKYPWTREYFAKVVKKLSRKKASVIGLDILLHKSRNFYEDSVFAASINKSGNVVLGYNFSDPDPYSFLYSDSIIPQESTIEINTVDVPEYKTIEKKIMDIGSVFLQNNADKNGYLNMFHSDDGVIRKSPLFIKYLGKLYPSLALQMSAKYLGVHKDKIRLYDKEKVVLLDPKIPREEDIVVGKISDDKIYFENSYIEENKYLVFNDKFKVENNTLKVMNNGQVYGFSKYNIKGNNAFIPLRSIGIRSHKIVNDTIHNIKILRRARFSEIKDKIEIPVNKNNEMIIHYKGTWKTYRTVHFYDVLTDRAGGKKTFRNKIILIGASLRGLMDLRSTPVQENLPGVEVHANIINTIINEDFLHRIEKSYIAIIMALIIFSISYLILSNLNIFITIGIASFFMTGYYYFSWYLFKNMNIFLDLSRPLATTIICLVVSYAIKYYLEEKSKRYVRNTLGKYIPDVVSEAMLQDSRKLILGGERKTITMFFSDIRSFTTLSEKTDPAAVVAFLNMYLTRMTNIVKNNQGTIDKFIGDAMVCLFGAPIENNHPYNACRSAIRIIEELEKMRPEIEQKSLKDINIGIGINTGEVTVGNIGSDELFDYTAIGDNMNLASRMEGLTKYYGVKILITGQTYNEIKEYDFVIREIDNVMVKGKKKAIKCYEIISDVDCSENEKKCAETLKGMYEKALEKYYDGHFEKAKTMFNDVLKYKENDGPTINMIKRIEIIENRVNLRDNWNGIWEMRSK